MITATSGPPGCGHAHGSCPLAMATTTGGGTARNRWILHFTHIDNVPAIISGGRLVCDKAAQPYLQTEVGDSAIKEARRRRVLTAGPGGTVADYVPFYFAPRSPMMFRIACDHRDGVPGRYPDGDRPLVYFAATAGAVVDAGLAWVATDGNAANAATEFSTDVTRLDAMIDWAVMVASQWNNTTTDPDRQRRRMAEFLVHREVPLTVVHQIAAYSDWYADRVRQAVAGHALANRVVVRPGWYYGYGRGR